ncbi:MAG: recombinase RarA, partial [Epsilonproteobacteria bacterium]
KSIRGSDVDASLYYLGRLIDGGESVEYITRRLVILASEDIGNSNPNALNLATSTMISTSKIGYPESRIILAQCVIYLASCPKSNSSYNAINSALDYIKNNEILDIPEHLKDSHIGYKYPHDFNGFIEQNYLKKNLEFYKSKSIGYEKTLNEWLSKIKI